MIIAVDNGNVNTKTASTVFTSGFTKHDLKPPLSKEVLEWKGSFYTLTGKRGIYERDKTQNDNAYILTLFAMAKQILIEGKYQEEIDVDLAVGLPPEHFAILQDSFRDYFFKYGSRIEFIYMEKPFKINLKSVNVFPQAFAAIAGMTGELSEYSRCYVIDIGGYTTDVLLLKNGKPDLSYLRSLETGIIKMNNNIKARVNTATGSLIEEDHIYDVLMNRKNILPNNIKTMIREESKKHVDYIINDLRELGIDLLTSPSVFVGGGTLLLIDHIKERDDIAPPRFVESISANAIGYTLLNQLILSRNDG